MKYIIRDDPQPALRPRWGNGHVFDSQKLLKTMLSLQIAKQHGNNPPYKGPLAIYIQFYIAVPPGKKNSGRINKPHVFKPDIDNLSKLIMDCVTKSHIIHDDCSICELHAAKRYHKVGATVFEIVELDNCNESIQDVAKDTKTTESNTSKSQN